jgi:hypothetical protein
MGPWSCYFSVCLYSSLTNSHHTRVKETTRFKMLLEPGNTKGGKYQCTVDLLFDRFGISCMTTDNFCFYLQNRVIQTS